MNRLTNHFAAIAPAKRPEPPKGFDHFAFGTFDRRLVNFVPRNIEDSPLALKYDDVRFETRYGLHDVSRALQDVRDFNRMMLDLAAMLPAGSRGPWATLAWQEGGYESLRLDYARCVTPFTYWVNRIAVPPDFKPTAPLDVPGAQWSDCGPVSSGRCASVEEAVRVAVNANRKFRPGVRKGRLPLWNVVIALEADAMNESDHLVCNGRTGMLAECRHRRFHVVGESWPMAPEVLALVKGGGHNA